jgi:ABC-type multidrug transport system ATPase subunit
MSLCDRIYCLEEGQVIAEGTPEEILANARVIASYLGTDPSAVKRSNGSGTRRRGSRASRLPTPAPAKGGSNGSGTARPAGVARTASKEESR